MQKSSPNELSLPWKFASFFLRIEEMVDPIYVFIICAIYYDVTAQDGSADTWW